MATAEKQAQKAKADHLRSLIQEIVSGDSQPASSKPENPREFVRRKMKEAESAKKENEPSETEETCSSTS